MVTEEDECMKKVRRRIYLSKWAAENGLNNLISFWCYNERNTSENRFALRPSDVCKYVGLFSTCCSLISTQNGNGW